MLRQFWGYVTILGLGLLSCPALSAPMTPRQAFYYHAHRGNMGALIQLQKMGYPIDVSDDHGNSALCEAVIKRDQQAIQTLIHAGADTNATCMQALSVNVKPNTAPTTVVAETDQRDKLASPQMSKIPNPPAEPLSKNTKVGIGLGVVTLAATGVGVAMLASGGGGGGAPLNCVDGVQVGKSCQCNPHAVGALCDSCEAGYGMYGTKSCHETKECKQNAEQIGDECYCKKGFDFKGEDGNCYKDLKCSNIYANMHQKNGECVCDTGYYKYGGNPTGCYQDQHCEASKHLIQINNSCVCDSGYPVPPTTEGGSCSSCGVEGATWDGHICLCPSTKPIAEYSSDNVTLEACHSCNEYVSAATWDGNKCYCTNGVTTWDSMGVPTACETCPSGSTYNKATNKCDCGGGEIAVDGVCVTDLHCDTVAHSTGKQASATACECVTGWAGNMCNTCASGYVSVNGDCVQVLKTASLNNGKIEDKNWTGGAVVGLYHPEFDVVNAQASTTEGEDDPLVATIRLKRKEGTTGDMYGIYSESMATGLTAAEHTKSVSSIIDLVNKGKSDTYGICAKDDVRLMAVDLGSPIGAEVTNYQRVSMVSIKNWDGGKTIGAYSMGKSAYGISNAQYWVYINNKMDIYNKNGTSAGLYAPTGDAYGIYYTGGGYSGTFNNDTQNELNLYQWGGQAYGLEGKNVYSTNKIYLGSGDVLNIGEWSKAVHLKNTINMWLVGTQDQDDSTIASGKIVGMEGKVGEVINSYEDIISLHLIGGNHTEGTTEVTVNTDNTKAIGIYAQPGVTVINEGLLNSDGTLHVAPGRIYIDRVGFTYDDVTYTAGSTGKAYGIYVKGGQTQTVTNNGLIVIAGTINIESPLSISNIQTTKGDFDRAYGIYVENGKNVTVVNNGWIVVDADNGAGIYFKDGTGGTVINRGIIKLPAKNMQCTGTTCYDQSNAVIRNGATIGGTTTSTASVVLNGANLVAAKGSAIETDGALDLDLHLSSDITTFGFSDTYTEAGMIQAGDTSGLHLISDSALFDASLNGSDVIMTMKGFDTATSNKSLAEFLSKNYALGNNEAFYNKLKSFGDMNALTDSLNKLTGKDMLSRFNFEDMTMMRELNFDMNEKLFHNKEQHFALAGSVSPMAFRGDTGSNARYSLFNKRNGNTSIGLGVAFTNIRSDDAHDKDNRQETSYQLILPMGYKTHGFNLVTSPRIGYARGTYDRTGFDDQSYDGTIEKRVFGLMNEARYPITIGKWKFEPSAEFNILGYQQKGHEDNREFALNIQNQNTYSVEGGIGLYAIREEELDKDSTLKLTAGVAAYHEFADPYKLRVGMNGMEGAFMLYDENRSENRGVIRAGFDYVYRDLSLYGSLISYIDRETRTSAKTGMKVKF